jgi:hypothetical protein
LLLPLLLALFYLSNARQRKSPTFICIILAIIFAFTEYIFQIQRSVRLIWPHCGTHFNIHHQFQALFDPFAAAEIFSPAVFGAIGFFQDMPNFFCDIALFCRMLSVFPYASTPRPKFAAIFGPAVLIKAVRFAVVIVILVANSQQAVGAGLTYSAAPQWLKADKGLAVLDNGCVHADVANQSLLAHPCECRYASGFFLWKLRGAGLSERSLGTSTGMPHLPRSMHNLMHFKVSSAGACVSSPG